MCIKCFSRVFSDFIITTLKKKKNELLEVFNELQEFGKIIHNFHYFIKNKKCNNSNGPGQGKGPALGAIFKMVQIRRNKKGLKGKNILKILKC